MYFKTLLWTLVLAGTLMDSCCSGETCPDYPADIYFLLDASASPDLTTASIDYNRMKTFVQYFVNSVTLGDSDMRIGLYTYTDSATRRFQLDKYNDSTQMNAAIDKLPLLAGDRYPNRAVSSANLYAFRDYYGARPTAENIMVLITRGPDEQPDMLKVVADAARSNNTKLITIGVSSALNFTELQEISYVPEYALMVNSSSELHLKRFEFPDIVRRAAIPPGGCGTGAPVVLPNDVQCAARENLDDGDLKSVTLQCTTSSVYPEAICEFIRTRYQDGIPIPVQAQVTYVHTAQNASSFQSVCSAIIYPKEMGVGIHTFRAYVYPNATDGRDLVKPTKLKGFVKLKYSKVKHFCQDDLLDGYFCGKPGYCNCTVVEAGWPKGIASWMEEGFRKRPNPLPLVYDAKKPEVTYTCESVSSLGRTFGSMLKIDNEVKCS